MAFFRKEVGLSQEELAKLLKVTKQTVWRLESGVTNVGADMIEALAMALRVDPVLLVSERSLKPGAFAEGHVRKLDQVMECLNKALKLAQAHRAYLSKNGDGARS